MEDIINAVEEVVSADHDIEAFIVITVGTEGEVVIGAPFDDESSIKQILDVACANFSEFGYMP